MQTGPVLHNGGTGPVCMPRMKKRAGCSSFAAQPQDLLPRGHGRDGPLCRGGQAARCVCKRDNALPLCLRQYPQLFQRLARKARQQRSQKSVARARSVHRVHFAGRQQPAARRSTVVRAPRPQRHQNQRRAPGRQRVRSRRQLRPSAVPFLPPILSRYPPEAARPAALLSPAPRYPTKTDGSLGRN